MPRAGGRLATALLLALAIRSAAAAAPGDLLWSDVRVPGRATAVATGGRSLVVVAQLASGYAIRVYDAATGAVRRQHAWPGKLASAVLVRGGLIVVVGGSELVALDLPSGQVRWRETIGNGDAARLVGAGSRVFLADGDGVLTAHALRTGHTLWRNDAGPVASFVVRRDRVAAIGTRTAAPESLVVRLIDANTGAGLWEDIDQFDSKGASGEDIAWAGNRILAAGSAERLYDGGDIYDNRLIRAYEATSGARLWDNELWAASDQVAFGITTHGNQAFALTRGTSGDAWRVEAYETRGGTQVWDTGPIFFDGQVTGPLFAGGALHVSADPFSTPAAFLAASLAPHDGSVRWRAPADAPGTLSSGTALTADGERLHVGGSVYDLGTGESRLGVWAYSLR
jgi:outer membrane protein assembly factor BamB